MRSPRVLLLILGDVVTLALVTVFGFASHDELGTAGVRMLTTFIPLVVAWLLIAPHLKVFDLAIVSNPRQLWRPFWAMVLAAPMATWMRGAWLRSPILPIFVVILGGVSALALFAWRLFFWLITTRLK
ncbi:MAG: DUF3054 domain-containing protein [Anaerolineales bacterium]|jgi:hypothetical protein